MKMKLITISAVVLSMGLTAVADWNIGDGHVMHYPQMPKVDGGWDVMTQYYISLADDWQASQSGRVDDLHTWISFKDDVLVDIETVHVAVWADAGGMPQGTDLATEALWHMDVPMADIEMVMWGQGDQGWLDPRSPQDYILSDHQNVYQLNFDFSNLIDDDVFHQVAGTTYWLEFAVQAPHEITTYPDKVGWKESSDSFGAGAVYRESQGVWNAFTDPITGEAIDMAFVVTPEPSTISMVALISGCIVFARRRFS